MKTNELIKIVLNTLEEKKAQYKYNSTHLFKAQPTVGFQCKKIKD